VKETFTKRLRSQRRKFFGGKVEEVVRKAGSKLVFDGGLWVCYRLPGTEAVMRVYSEAASSSN
jgi:phosphoglucomutase